jgi:hypothetical protein
MKEKTISDTRTVDQLLAAAVEADKAGRSDVAESLLTSARWQERAKQLEGKPRVYWADGQDLMTESADGSGPCSVFALTAGSFSMAALAARLNRDDGAPLAPRADLTSDSAFIADSEYVSREQPLTVFCGFDLASRVAEILNAEVL